MGLSKPQASVVVKSYILSDECLSQRERIAHSRYTIRGVPYELEAYVGWDDTFNKGVFERHFYYPVELIIPAFQVSSPDLPDIEERTFSFLHDDIRFEVSGSSPYVSFICPVYTFYTDWGRYDEGQVHSEQGTLIFTTHLFWLDTILDWRAFNAEAATVYDPINKVFRVQWSVHEDDILNPNR